MKMKIFVLIVLVLAIIISAIAGGAFFWSVMLREIGETPLTSVGKELELTAGSMFLLGFVIFLVTAIKIKHDLFLKRNTYS